jgi:hypothetical protein
LAPARPWRLVLVVALVIFALAFVLVFVLVVVLVFVLIGLVLVCELLDVGVLALLVIARIMFLNELAILDHPTPRTCLVLSGLD